MNEMSSDEQIETLKLQLLEMQRQRDDWRNLHGREMLRRLDWEERYKQMFEYNVARSKNRAS